MRTRSKSEGTRLISRAVADFLGPTLDNYTTRVVSASTIRGNNVFVVGNSNQLFGDNCIAYGDYNIFHGNGGKSFGKNNNFAGQGEHYARDKYNRREQTPTLPEWMLHLSSDDDSMSAESDDDSMFAESDNDSDEDARILNREDVPGDKNGHAECLTCCVNKACMLFQCGHMVLCKGCDAMWMEKCEKYRCVVCNARIVNKLQKFV